MILSRGWTRIVIPTSAGCHESLLDSDLRCDYAANLNHMLAVDFEPREPYILKSELISRMNMSPAVLLLPQGMARGKRRSIRIPIKAGNLTSYRFDPRSNVAVTRVTSGPTANSGAHRPDAYYIYKARSNLHSSSLPFLTDTDSMFGHV